MLTRRSAFGLLGQLAALSVLPSGPARASGAPLSAGAVERHLGLGPGGSTITDRSVTGRPYEEFMTREYLAPGLRASSVRHRLNSRMLQQLGFYFDNQLTFRYSGDPELKPRIYWRCGPQEVECTDPGGRSVILYVRLLIDWA